MSSSPDPASGCSRGADGVAGTAARGRPGTLGVEHDVVSALAVPPLAAVAVAAWWVHRRLLGRRPRARALRSRGGRDRGRDPRRARLGRARRRRRLGRAVLPRRPVPACPWRDYVTLTKPRIMSLLLVTGAAGMFVGAQGVPSPGSSSPR